MSNKNNPTTMIKCKFSNTIHQLLEPNMNMKYYERFRNKVTLTDKQKLEIFDKIVAAHNSCSTELRNYRLDKQWKKHINKQRIARGWTPKKRTTKEEYDKIVA
jgi:hypothetical protein